jgi:hypothetical protein
MRVIEVCCQCLVACCFASDFRIVRHDVSSWLCKWLAPTKAKFLAQNAGLCFWQPTLPCRPSFDAVNVYMVIEEKVLLLFFL